MSLVASRGPTGCARIGGASAGAIAAAAAAAAEFGRADGGFEKLERLPAELAAESRGGGSLLFRLFQPQPGTVGLYRLLTAALNRRWLAVGVAAVRAVPGWALAGAFPR